MKFISNNNNNNNNNNLELDINHDNKSIRNYLY